MITIYAEKFDVASKIAAALGGFNYNGIHINMSNLGEYKTRIDKDIKRNGFIKINFRENEYAITWGQGHMCGLYQASDYDPEYALWSNIPLPFIPDEYKIKIRDGYDFKTKQKTKTADKWVTAQLKLIKNLFNKSEYIINATDCDREGELIFSYVYEYTNCKKPYKRMIINSQTEEGLLSAFNNLKGSDYVINTEYAGRARSIADWVVGANISAKMTLKYGRAFNNLKMITAGRIQTVILDFIVTREKAIRDFKPEKFYYIEGIFSKENESYLGKHTEKQIMDKVKAVELFRKLNGKNGVVSKKDTSPFKKDVPVLYNLTNLSKDINTLFGYTAAETLSICQSLYEKGYTTYPRTESCYLTDDMKNEVDNVLEMLSSYDNKYKEIIGSSSDRNYTKRHFNSAKVDSHFAIIPTHQKPNNLTEKEKNVYDIIARSLIKIIFKEARGQRTNIETVVDGEVFKTSGNIITDPQWMLADINYGKKKDDIIPDVNVGDIVSGEYFLKEEETRPPARYTDASLLLAMQTASKEIEDEKLKKILETSNKGGIGRPSTQASLIESVVSRYCIRKGKTIIPTEDAIKIIDVLPIPDLKSPEMTAKWEEDLDKIARGELDKSEFIGEIESLVVKWCKEIDDAESLQIAESAYNKNVTDLICPSCGKPLIKYDNGYGCSGYKKNDPSSCSFFLNNTIAKKLTKKDLKQLLTEGKTSRPYMMTSKNTGNKFLTYFQIENDKIAFIFNSGIKCPKCGKELNMNAKAISCPDGHVLVWVCEYGENKMKKWDNILNEIKKAGD